MLAVIRSFSGIHACLELSGVSGPSTLEIQSSRDFAPKAFNLIYLDLDPQMSMKKREFAQSKRHGWLHSLGGSVLKLVPKLQFA